MKAEDIAAVLAAVVMLTQVLKWMRVVDDSHGPWVVLLLSAASVGLYRWSQILEPFMRQDAWALVTAWIDVAAGSAGVFGYTRALSTAVTATKEPPAGAGQNPVVPIP